MVQSQICFEILITETESTEMHTETNLSVKHKKVCQPIQLAGGFNQPIMCGGEPRAMLCKTRGKADPPIYTIQICIPKHGRLLFSLNTLYVNSELFLY